jgi:hypothetical protein
MKNLFFVLFVITIVGCGNLSPRNKQQQQPDNSNGKIGEMEQMANSLKSEIAKLQAQADIQNSKLSELQQGIANFQDNNKNSGIQILSGTGGLVVAIVAIVALGSLVFYYRYEYQKQNKISNIMAENIVLAENDNLKNSVFQAVLHTDVEENVLNLIKKHQQRLR